MSSSSGDPVARERDVISVVLVDDLPEIRQMVRTALRLRGGFEVVGEASDGAGAVEIAASLQPDIVVLDLGLPGLAGREVLTRIRESSALSKIVVFTGTPGQGGDISQRADAFVLKDADLAYLVDLLEAFGKRRGRDAELFLVNDPASVAMARRFVRAVLQGWQVEDVMDEVLLIVSELVTNAFEHAQSPCRLRLSLTASGLRVDVHDEGRGTPDLRAATEQSEHGRGLYLVATFAAAWGTEQSPEGGKIVWAELPSQPAPHSRGGPAPAGGIDLSTRLVRS